MTGFGFFLVFFGLPIWFVGAVRFLAVVYRSSVLWFFGCLFIPFVDLIYFLLNMKQTWRPMLTATVGSAMTVVGYYMGGLKFLR
jgi:uncharacterized membrane protein